MKTTPDLNVYVLKEIFNFLTLEQRSKCSRVCRTWHEAETYLKIESLSVYLGMFKSNESKNFVFVKNDKQLKSVFASAKLAQLKELKIFSFKSSVINLPIVDLKNFQNLERLEISGHFYENNIFMVLLQNKIVLNELKYLSAPYVHINIINLVFPNLKHIRAVHLLMPVFEEFNRELKWTKFDHCGVNSCPYNVLVYLVQKAPLIEELNLTLDSLSFSFICKFFVVFDNLIKLNLNIIPSNLTTCLEDLQLTLPLFIDRNIKLKVNGLPVYNLDLNIFIDRPFKTSYHKLTKNFNLEEEDSKFLFDNFNSIEILTQTPAKIKSLKKFNLKLNNVLHLKYKNDVSNSNYLFKKFFIKIPNLEFLEMLEIDLLNQEQLNSLPILWPNLMSINLKSNSMKKLDVKFLELFKCLCEIKFENLNFLNDTNLKFIVNRLNYLNQLVTINCLFNLKHTYSEFMKKSQKHSNVQFFIDLNGKYRNSNLSKWKANFNN